MERNRNPSVFETERLIVRHFREDDWRDLLEIAISKENDPFAASDAPWPTSPDDIRSACAYFASGKQFWAVEVKALAKVVCFVNFNGVNEKNEMDIGHVMNAAYCGRDYEYEALGILYDYCFASYAVDAVIAVWALRDEKKLAPLYKLGMEVSATWMDSAVPEDPDGARNRFEFCVLRVTKAAWEAHRMKKE